VLAVLALVTVGAVGFGAWFAWHAGPTELGAGAEVGKRSPPGTSGRRAVTTPKSRVPVRTETEAPSSERGVLSSALEALLLSPNIRPRMSEVPPLDAAAAAELVRRYHAAEGIPNKYRLVRILAYGGRREVVPLIQGALTEEFRGQSVSRADDGLLVHMLRLLGLVASEDQEALDFLLQGCDRETWAQREMWRIDGARAGADVLAGDCIMGLVLSQRPEADRLLQELRDNPDRAAALGDPSAVVDAAFLKEMLEKHGKTVLDTHLYDLDHQMAYFTPWRRTTTNGIEWGLWAQDVRGRAEALRQQRGE